jgi:hypothetical protein
MSGGRFDVGMDGCTAFAFRPFILIINGKATIKYISDTLKFSYLSKGTIF